MGRTYYVYLSEDDDTDPESGTQHTDWIAFICTKAKVSFKANNLKEDLPAHKSFEVKTGEYVMTLAFSDVRITSMGTNTAGKTSYNSLMAFCTSHAVNGGSKINGLIYMDLGDGNPAYMDFPNASSSPVNYMQCRVKQYSFTFEAAKGYAVGSIKLEEEWTP